METIAAATIAVDALAPICVPGTGPCRLGQKSTYTFPTYSKTYGRREPDRQGANNLTTRRSRGPRRTNAGRRARRRPPRQPGRRDTDKFQPGDPVAPRNERIFAKRVTPVLSGWVLASADFVLEAGSVRNPFEFISGTSLAPEQTATGEGQRHMAQPHTRSPAGGGKADGGMATGTGHLEPNRSGLASGKPGQRLLQNGFLPK